MTTLRFVLAALAVVTCGCVNPYAQYYTPTPSSSMPLFKHAGAPKVVAGSNDPEQDALKMIEQGFWQVGYSSFSHTNLQDFNGASQKAKELGAAVVILYGPSNPRRETANQLVYQPGETYTTTEQGTMSGHSTASAYGSGGYVYGSGSSYGSYSGRSTTTTPGRLVNVPYETTRFDYGATYWAEIDPQAAVFGAFVRNLDNEARQELQRNAGVVVVAVMEKTPAFDANLLRGDVLVQIGDTVMRDTDSYERALRDYRGKLVEVKLFRQGKPYRTQLTLRGGLLR